MTRQTIDRLGMMSYGLLIFGIANGSIRRELGHDTLQTLPVLLPMIVVNLLGVTVLVYCLVAFIRHLFVENMRVGAGGKALWLVLFLFLSLFSMLVYWYVYMVRERLMDGEQIPSAIGNVPSVTSSLA